jgi:hypothetical protein
MTKAQEMLDLADRIAETKPGWLPISGHVRSFTFTLNEADQAIEALRLAAQADAPGGVPQSPLDPCPYAIDGCVLENDEIGPCLCANAVSRPDREGQ